MLVPGTNQRNVCKTTQLFSGATRYSFNSKKTICLKHFRHITNHENDLIASNYIYQFCLKTILFICFSGFLINAYALELEK